MTKRRSIARDCLVYDGFWRVRQVTIEEQSNSPLERQVVEAREAVAVLLFDPERDVVTLVRQFRAPPFVAHGATDLIEVCAGVLDEGEEPAACALREAWEETGIEAHPPQRVGRVYSSPGVCTERVTLFVAKYGVASPRGEGGGLVEESEEIDVLEIPAETAFAMVRSGEIDDAKTVILLQLLELDREGGR